jgi:hypothetical protein
MMFPSKVKELVSEVVLPEFRGLKILMMPIVFGDDATVPDKDCIPMLNAMRIAMPQHEGKVVYLTVDQNLVEAGKTHRRPGLHVDGYPHTEVDKRFFGLSGIWAGVSHGGTWGGGGGWGGGNKNLYWWDGTGLLTISSVEGCKVWHQEFKGEPKVEGDCEHLREQCREENAVTLKANVLYWMNPACVHESLPMNVETRRTFVRLSLPSKCDWYEGCTPNPLGVKPVGKTSSRRRFMDD